MNTPGRDRKRAERQLRGYPPGWAAEQAVADELGGCLWCLVAGRLDLVSPDGGDVMVSQDDLRYYAILGYVEAQPERVHSDMESALTFVRSRSAPAVRPAIDL